MPTLQQIQKEVGSSQSFHLTGIRTDLPSCIACPLIAFCEQANIMPSTRGCHDAQRSEPKKVTSKGPKRTPRQR